MSIRNMYIHNKYVIIINWLIKKKNLCQKSHPNFYVRLFSSNFTQVILNTPIPKYFNFFCSCLLKQDAQIVVILHKIRQYISSPIF